MNAIDHKCPSCAASLPYNPEKGLWKCEYCLSEYTLEDLEKFETKFNNQESNKTKKNRRKMDVDEYTCPSCGAQIITDENTTATFCVYCGNTSIMKNRLQGVFEPDAVIPFKTTKEQAIEAFKKCKKGKLFAPKDFGLKENIEKITGVYIPFWLYDCTIDGDIDATGTKVTSWRRGDYRYTKTDTYRVIRGGEATFEKVPVDGSKKFDDNTMDSIEPFSYDELTDFSASYLSGFLAEKYDVNDEEAYERAALRVKNTFKDSLKNDARGYSSVIIKSDNFNMSGNEAKYALLPVWMLNIKYNGKMHTFAMNGQTGKMVGNIPIAVHKAVLWALGAFGGSSLIITLIMYLMGGV